jgi:hypothetical protein
MYLREGLNLGINPSEMNFLERLDLGTPFQGKNTSDPDLC